SVDFDFVTKDTFSPDKIFKKLGEKGKIELEQKDGNTLTVVLEGVSCSFLSYDYPILHEFLLFEDRIKLAGIADIAAMKVAAVAGRGIKRDFVDLYFICQKDYSLPEVIEYYQKKFAIFSQDLHHVYKSLVYFEDAEEDSMPHMFQEADWEHIKSYFTEEVSKLVIT
ncbi:MAG: nucleotidyl transferase AbiEii/AbiGii toxin family protein, partial [bacterium]